MPRGEVVCSGFVPIRTTEFLSAPCRSAQCVIGAHTVTGTQPMCAVVTWPTRPRGAKGGRDALSLLLAGHDYDDRLCIETRALRRFGPEAAFDLGDFDAALGCCRTPKMSSPCDVARMKRWVLISGQPAAEGVGQQRALRVHVPAEASGLARRSRCCQLFRTGELHELVVAFLQRGRRRGKRSARAEKLGSASHAARGLSRACWALAQGHGVGIARRSGLSDAETQGKVNPVYEFGSPHNEVLHP